MSARTRWLAGGTAVLVIAVGAVAWVLLARSGSSDKSAVVSSPGSSTTTTRVGRVPSSGGGTSVTVGIICTSPTDASQSLVNAWIAGDRAAAARCASTSAVAKLFQTGGAGAQWTFQGCNGTGATPTCQFSYQGGSANLSIAGSTAAGWKVTAVSFTAD